MRLRMQGKVVLLYSLLILFAMQLSGVYLVNSLENYYLRNFADSQEAQAELMGNFLRRYLVEEEQQQGEHIASLIAEFSSGMSETETLVLDRHGRLLAGPERGPHFVEGGRVVQDDILMALAGSQVENIRVDPETGMRSYYLAYPVKNASSVVGVVFLRGSLEHIYHTLEEIKFILITGWGIVLGIAIVIGFLITRTITAPIKEVTSRAAAMAGGGFSQAIEVKSDDEIGDLGEMFNYLAARLHDTLEEISAEKTKVEAILNYMTDGILALNKRQEIIHVNPAARKIMQWAGSPADFGVSGKSVLSVFIEPDELEEILRRSTPYTKEVHFDTSPERVFQLHFAPFKESGEEQGLLVVIHDVTSERIYVRMQQEFVANVSHELKTPLTTLKNYVETLLGGAQQDPDVRGRFLRVLEKETDRMVKMVRDLLLLSQMDYQETRWSKEEVDMMLVVRESMEQVELEAAARQIELEAVYPKDADCHLLLDRDGIRQVMLNLLENALKFTPDGGQIEVRVVPEKDRVCVSISDTGVGIPEEEIDRVFERFYRVDKTRSRESGGSGLGLPIARQIIEAHGGTIGMEPEPERGTSVTFCLPRTGHFETGQERAEG